MLKIIRTSPFRAKFESDSKEIVKQARDFLTIFNDGAFFSEYYRNGDWDGNNRYFDKFNEIDYGLSFFLFEKFQEEGIDVEFIDFDKYHGKLDISDCKLTENLWEHQSEAVKTFFTFDYGVMVIPTRGGKTFTSAECIRLASEKGYKKALFIVDGSDLFTQTVKEFSKFFGIPESEIGQIQGRDKMFFKDINVAMIQTLSSVLYPKKSKDSAKWKANAVKKRELTKFLKSLNFLVVDEIHEFSSKKRLNTIKTCDNIDFFMALSATPYKSEDENANMNIRGLVGNIVYTVPEEILQERGVLVKDEVFIIVFEEHSKLPKIKDDDNTTKYIQSFEQNIIREEKRNEMITKVIKILDDLRLKTLVMFTRKEHGYIISEKTNKPFVSGDDDKEARNVIKEEFLKDKGKVLLASDIYKKGVSLNSCDVLYNVDGGLEQSNVIQKRGRVLASFQDKKSALIIDIFDNIGYFNEHALNRLQAYEEKVGKDRITVFYANDKNFYNELQYSIENLFYGESGV